MDNLENDILELFEDDPGNERISERSRGDSRSRNHNKRRRHGRYSGSPQKHLRREDYSGSEDDDVDMDTGDDVDIEETGEVDDMDGESDNGPLDEWGDDLMGGQKDRRWLASLTEIERERILAERQEKRDLLNEQRELRMKLKAGIRVSAADQSGRTTRAGRVRRDAAGRGEGSLSDLKRTRERRRRGESDRWSSSLSDEEVSETEAEPAASLSEINTICLSRNQLEQWLFRPFLAETIIGCLVRIVTRTKDTTGEYNQYKMMEVLDVIQGEGRTQPPYHLNKTLTDKYLTLRFGATEKDYSMETISNSSIKPEEHSAWEAALRADHVRGYISVDHVQKKLKDLDRARNYQLSEAEVSQMIAERNRLRKIESGGSGVSVALERSQLNQLHVEARQNSDWEQLKKIEARLEELDKLTKQTQNGGVQSTPAAATSHRPLLAPSTSSRVGGGPEIKGVGNARRKTLLTPSSSVRRLPQASPSIVKQANGVGNKFALVPELKIPELSLRSKVTPGYVQMMAENGGYDMSFLKL
ncbi:RNA polymerase-associated protein rtf1 [Coemansia sp. RSA 1365]|nr:RNA polymerase-associated protein rtf1 [Coemansia sp. RSA 1365]